MRWETKYINENRECTTAIQIQQDNSRGNMTAPFQTGSLEYADIKDARYMLRHDALRSRYVYSHVLKAM